MTAAAADHVARATLENVALGSDERDFRALVRGIANRVIAPMAGELDRTQEFPHRSMKELARTDLLGLLVPEDLGGTNASKLHYVLAVEEIARACGATATTFMTQAHSLMPLMLAGNAAQQRRWVPGLCQGTSIGALALTEPDAGSDLAAVRTRAVRTGDGSYRLSGQKMFITNGGVADVLIVLARTGEEAGAAGLSAFVVDGNPSGLTRGAPLDKMGIRASNTAELSFDEVHVAADQLLGDEGDGFRIALSTLDGARLSTAAQALGLAQGAFDRAIAHAGSRQQFGRPIGRFQAVSFKLFDMYSALASARSLLYDVARVCDEAHHPDITRGLAALAKVRCSDMAMALAVEAVQVLGGAGYLRESEVERIMRDAKITQIYDGTNEVNRIVGARALGIGT